MRRAIALDVFLFLAIPVCVWSQGGRFKEIYIGEPRSTLPFKCDPDGPCRGRYQSVYVEANLGGDEVSYFNVVYSLERKGEGWEIKVTASSLPTLGQAVRIHSLQPGFGKPRFGYAKKVSGEVYGVVDLTNRITYAVQSPTAIGPHSLVTVVGYISQTAPVLHGGEKSPLREEDSVELLEVAETSPPYTGTVEVYDSIEEKRAALVKHEAELNVVTSSVRVESRGGGRFKEIYIGEPASALPFECDVECGHRYQRVYVNVSIDDGKVSNFDVVYSLERKGEGWEIKVTAPSLPTLGQALKIHSLQPGFSKPCFGYATNIDGEVYGIVDVANRISYAVLKPSEIEPDSLVTNAGYVGEKAPVVLHGKERLLPQDKAAKLLEAADKMPPYEGTVEVYDSIEEERAAHEKEDAELKAVTRTEALDKLNAQIDVVIGKGRRTLALIERSQTWYEVDKNHPDALEEAKDLRAFYPAFQEEYDKLWKIVIFNKDLWKGKDSADSEAFVLIREPFTLNKEIESQMRRLKAMGFEL